ncbi:MAG: class I SAM-dependent methyltransferase [Parachlamydiaceae bacterium]
MLNPASQIELLHFILKEQISPNDLCIDATCGNGFDTLFLARLTLSGKVYAFDVQETALSRTKEKLEKEGLLDRVQLIHASHKTFPEYIQEGSIKAIVYNLGYLPGSDKKVVTTKESTLESVENALKLLRQDGLLCLMLYTGHREGADEAVSLKEWAKNLPSHRYHVLHCHAMNRNLCPELMLILGTPPRGGNS